MFPLLRLLHQYIWAAFCFPHGPDPGEDRGQMISPEPPGPLSSKARGNNTRTGKKKKKKKYPAAVSQPLRRKQVLRSLESSCAQPGLRYHREGNGGTLPKTQSTNQPVPRGPGISALFPMRTQGDSRLGIRG